MERIERNTPLMTRFFLWLFPLMLAVLLTVGCSTLQDRPVPPDYLKISASGEPTVTELIEPVGLASIGARVFSGGGAEALDPGVEDPAQRLLAARAAARRQSLRTMSATILNTPVNGGLNLRQILTEHPDSAQALEKLIDARTQVAFHETGGNQAVAEAMLKGSELVPLLSGQDRKTLLSDLTPEEQETVKQQAHGAALKSARDRMRIGLLEIELKNGRRLGDVLAEDEKVMAQLNAMIDSALPDDVEYAEDGVCTLTFFFDQNLARDLANNRGGWFGR